MDANLIDAVRVRLEAASTDELLRIWKGNDRERYSEEAFEAARMILEQRGVNVPAQDPSPGQVPVGLLSRGLDPASDAFWMAWLRPLLWVGMAVGGVQCAHLAFWTIRTASTGAPFDWPSVHSFSSFVEAVRSLLGFVLPPVLLAGAVLTLGQQSLGRHALLVWGWVQAVTCGVAILSFAARALFALEPGLQWAEWTLREAQENVTLGGYALLVVFFLTRPQITQAFQSPAPSFGPRGTHDDARPSS